MGENLQSGLRHRRGLAKLVIAAAAGTLLVSGCAATPPVEPQETREPATAEDYAEVVNRNAPAIELAAEDQGCFLDIAMDPHSEESRECINRASVAVAAMQDIHDQFNELGWPDAPAEVFSIGSDMHLAAALVIDEDGSFNVEKDCADPASEACSATVGGLIKAMEDTVKPMLKDWEDVGP